MIRRILIICLLLVASPAWAQLPFNGGYNTVQNNTAPTPPVGDSSPAIATTAFVKGLFGAANTSQLPIAATPSGILQFTTTASFGATTGLNSAACQGVAFGGRQSVQKWLTILDNFGNPFYLPVC